MSLLISFFAVSLCVTVIDSQSAFRYYEEDYVPGINTLHSSRSKLTLFLAAMFIDNVKGRVIPPQPSAHCINNVGFAAYLSFVAEFITY
jgi:hypothetical protein